MKRIALIPSYQPNDKLLLTVEELTRYGMEVLVVHDGSGPEDDAIFLAVEDLGATVLTQPESREKGDAVKTGLEWIRDREHGPYTVVTAGGDGRHTTKDIFRVCVEAELHPEGIALGCRGLDRKASLSDRLRNVWARLVYWVRTGAWVQDPHSGLRAFSGGKIPWMLDIAGSGLE